MGEHRPVGQLHETVDQRLRVNDHVYLVIRRAEQVWASMTSRPLFMSVAESIVIFPHRPCRVRERCGDGDIRELLA